MTQQLNSSIDQLRQKLTQSISKMQRIAQGQPQPHDEISIPIEIQSHEQELNSCDVQLQSQMQQLSLDNSKMLDEKIRAARDSLQKLRKSYRMYLNSKSQQLETVTVSAEEVNLQNAQQLVKDKQQNLTELEKNIKIIHQQQKQIQTVLIEGKEITDDLHHDIIDANQNVINATSKTKQFQEYLRNNKAPCSFLIIVIILTVLVWATGCGCSIGLSWGCKGSKSQ